MNSQSDTLNHKLTGSSDLDGRKAQVRRARTSLRIYAETEDGRRCNREKRTELRPASSGERRKPEEKTRTAASREKILRGRGATGPSRLGLRLKDGHNSSCVIGLAAAKLGRGKFRNIRIRNSLLTLHVKASEKSISGEGSAPQHNIFPAGNKKEKRRSGENRTLQTAYNFHSKNVSRSNNF